MWGKLSNLFKKIFPLIKNTIEILHLLGPKWALFRTLYAIKLRSGVIRRRTPCANWKKLTPDIAGQFFVSEQGAALSCIYATSKAEAICNGWLCFFCHKPVQSQLPPNWFDNQFNCRNQPSDTLQHRHWSEISDFAHGDIKCIWELSRFSWVYPLVRGYQIAPDKTYSDIFWQLTEDWADHNPPNTGVHWKCGQEIAIRMFALVTAYFAFVEADKCSSKRTQLLAEIIFESAKRIEANIGYALSQQNNHGISEAAGLFTAGISFNMEKWIKKGAKHLEEQVQALVYSDGSFSQHSANYHRVMLHACLWAIQLGRANGFEFSEEFIEHIRKAGKWLLALYDPQTGRMPNLGSNDGALILPYSACDYLDFRPTIQATGAVVDMRRWLSPGSWDDLALWLVPELGDKRAERSELKAEGLKLNARGGEKAEGSPEEWPSDSTGQAKVKEGIGLNEDKVQLSVLRHGGYAVFKRGDTKLIFRCPERFHHRPAQCDLLHVDLWDGGINLLRDAGTYSYNCEQPWQDYFKSVAAHNTVQFDDHDQMPKISRFLYGKWPQLDVDFINGSSVPHAEAVYTDWKGSRHKRRVEVSEDTIRVIDTLSGYGEKAVLRWRLAPELDWCLSGTTCSSGNCRLHVRVDAGLRRLKLTEGWESLYYQHKSPISVLELTAITPCSEIVTEIAVRAEGRKLKAYQ